jgi:hypothetical protein
MAFIKHLPKHLKAQARTSTNEPWADVNLLSFQPLDGRNFRLIFSLPSGHHAGVIETDAKGLLSDDGLLRLTKTTRSKKKTKTKIIHPKVTNPLELASLSIQPSYDSKQLLPTIEKALKSEGWQSKNRSSMLWTKKSSIDKETLTLQAWSALVKNNALGIKFIIQDCELRYLEMAV